MPMIATTIMISISVMPARARRAAGASSPALLHARRRGEGCLRCDGGEEGRKRAEIEDSDAETASATERARATARTAFVHSSSRRFTIASRHSFTSPMFVEPRSRFTARSSPCSLHRSLASPFAHCTAPFARFTVRSLHRSLASPFARFTVRSLHRSLASPFARFTVRSLHRSLASPFAHCTAPLASLRAWLPLSSCSSALASSQRRHPSPRHRAWRRVGDEADHPSVLSSQGARRW